MFQALDSHHKHMTLRSKMYVMRSTSTSRTWDIATANTPDGGPSQVVADRCDPHGQI